MTQMTDFLQAAGFGAARAQPLPSDASARRYTRLLGGPLTVRQRWLGEYASAPAPFLVTETAPGVTAVAVTSGIGMTTALGLTEELVRAW